MEERMYVSKGLNEEISSEIRISCNSRDLLIEFKKQGLLYCSGVEH